MWVDEEGHFIQFNSSTVIWQGEGRVLGQAPLWVHGSALLRAGLLCPALVCSPLLRSRETSPRFPLRLGK